MCKMHQLVEHLQKTATPVVTTPKNERATRRTQRSTILTSSTGGATSLLNVIIAISMVPGILLRVDELAKKYRTRDPIRKSVATTMIMLTA